MHDHRVLIYIIIIAEPHTLIVYPPRVLTPTRGVLRTRRPLHVLIANFAVKQLLSPYRPATDTMSDAHYLGEWNKPKNRSTTERWSTIPTPPTPRSDPNTRPPSACPSHDAPDEKPQPIPPHLTQALNNLKPPPYPTFSNTSEAYHASNKSPPDSQGHNHWKPLITAQTLRRFCLPTTDFNRVKTWIECMRNFLRSVLHFTKDNDITVTREHEYWEDTIPNISQHYLEKTAELLQRKERSCDQNNNEFYILIWDDPAPAYFMRMHHYWQHLHVLSYHSMHRSRNLYICVDSTAKLAKSDDWRVQNEWWNNQLKTLRHKFTYLLPYTQIVFIILGGRDLPDMMKVLLEFIKNDPIAQGDPSKFYHDVLFFLQFNYACHKPTRNSKRIKGWTEELRADYAKYTPIIKDLHSAAITGMGVTESWSNPKNYNALPSQCKTPNWMEAVLRPAVEILRKTNKPLLNLRKLFMEMEPVDDSDKWHYADTMDNKMSWFHAFAMCAHFCYNASHMKHAGDVIWHHQSRLQPHPQYGNLYQPNVPPTQIQEPIEPPAYAYQIAAPALEHLKQHCFQHLNPQRPPQNLHQVSQPQYPLPTPWTPYGERSLIRFHKLQNLQPTDAAAKAPPTLQPPSIKSSTPPPPPPRAYLWHAVNQSSPQPLPTETTDITNQEHRYLLPPFPRVTNDKLIGTEIFQLNVDGVKAGPAAEQVRSFRNAQTRDAAICCGQEVIQETIQMFQRSPYREIHNKPDQTDNPCMIAVNTKYANFIPGSEQIIFIPELKLKHLQCDIEYFGVNGKANVPLPDIYSAINLHYNATEARNNKTRTKETIKNILRTAKYPKIIFTGDFNAAFRQYRTTEAIERQLYDMGFLSFGIPNRDTDDHYQGEPCLTTILIPIDRDPAQHFPILIKPSVYMERNPSLVLSTPGHPNQGDPHHAQRTFIPGPPTTKSPMLSHRCFATIPGQTTPVQIKDETPPHSIKHRNTKTTPTGHQPKYHRKTRLYRSRNPRHD